MAYRTAQSALAERREEHFARLERIDEEQPISHRRLSPPLQRRLAKLRREAQPDDETAASLFQAEEAVDRYEAKLDEALGLSAEMRKWMNPMLPRRSDVLRWTSFTFAALLSMGAAVHYLGLTSFMYRALGGELARARPDLTASELFLAPAVLPPVEAQTEAELPAEDLDVSLSHATPARE